MTADEFKSYQRMLNAQRVNELKKKPLPTNKPLLEPEIKINVDISDLSLDNLPINIKEPVQTVKEEKAIKSNSKSLF